MLSKHLLVLILISIPQVGMAEDWSDGDRVLAGMFVVGQVISYSQAMDTLRDEECRELNPVIDGVYDRWGRAGVIGWKVGTTTLVLVAADRMPKYRKWILGISNVVVWSVVGYDVYVGVEFGW